MALIRGLGHNPPTAAYVNNLTLTLIVAVDSNIAIMDGKDDDTSVLPFATHNRRVNAILYNPLFKQVRVVVYTLYSVYSKCLQSISQSISQSVFIHCKLKRHIR